MGYSFLGRSGVSSRFFVIAASLSVFGCGGGDDDGGSVNNRPIAQPVTLSVHSSVPYLEQQLQASDQDGDNLQYHLRSAREGSGYEAAYLNPDTGKLNMTLVGGNTEAIRLAYQVSDGLLFSEQTAIVINVTDDARRNATGSLEIETDVLASASTAFFEDDIFGQSDEALGLPVSIDLSDNFPFPGDQGQQGSCVGWAVGYALKSYQEKLEEGWPFTQQTSFSPAWIYNQINGGEDRGSRLTDALDLIVNQGGTSLAYMPYSSSDFTSQPSTAARQDAARYKALSWQRVTGTQSVKAALTNRQAVVAGIDVYPGMNFLDSDNPVYNSRAGDIVGGHAVTIVGYDDTKYGGAFKIINSWGSDFGDEGYFWMPYSFAESGILLSAFVLNDAANTGEAPDIDPIEPVADALPNLQVKSWEVNYAPRPGGAGKLAWEVVNAGSAVAPAGWDLNLMISKDNVLGPEDKHVVYETIACETCAISPGESLQRSESSENRLPFSLPEDLENGTYYMGIWIDDLQKVRESNENDNVSFASNSAQIESDLPDIAINSWHASWSSSTGNGSLQYEVENRGKTGLSTGTWDINLVLSDYENPRQGNKYYLFYEDATFALAPGGTVFRNENNPASFDLKRNVAGNRIPDGQYYMSLWVDDLEEIEESNENNNISVGGNKVVVASSRLGFATEDRIEQAFNGVKLPDSQVLLERVEVSTLPSGERIMLKLQSKNAGEDAREGVKTLQSADVALFPVTSSGAMPPVATRLGSK